MSKKTSRRKTRRGEPDGERELTIEETSEPSLEQLRIALAEMAKKIDAQTKVLDLLLAANARQLQIAEAEHRFEYGDRPTCIARDKHGLFSRVEAALTDAAMRRGLTTNNNDERADNERSDQGDPGGVVHDPA